MKRTSVVIALALSLTNFKLDSAKANPALIAPAALCSNPITCVFLGTVVIGGATYYVWQNQHDRKKVRADSSGNVYTGNDKPFPLHDIGVVLPVRDRVISQQECDAYARQQEKNEGGIWQGIIEGIGSTPERIDEKGNVIPGTPLYNCKIKRVG